LYFCLLEKGKKRRKENMKKKEIKTAVYVVLQAFKAINSELTVYGCNTKTYWQDEKNCSIQVDNVCVI
jgi:hypothetical protein